MKIFKLILIAFLLTTPLQSEALPSFNPINKVIKEMDLNNQSTIAVSVKNVENSRSTYAKDEDKLLHPASSLKIFTFAPIYKTLGENYKFATEIYIDTKNNVYIKLGADPLLTTKNLRELFIVAKKNYNFSRVNKIYIDDTIIDKIPYPSGWLSDDYFPNTAMLSPYTLNQNKTIVNLYISADKKTAGILQPNPYKHSIVNELTIGNTNYAKLKKINGENNEIINIEGTITQDFEIDVPTANPKYNFVANLEQIFEKEKINYKKDFYFAKTPMGLKKVGEISHSIDEVGEQILKYSDNFAAEIAFKVAGGKFKNKAQMASTSDGVEMFYNYYSKLGLDMKDIKVVDGSGVSRYNLLFVDWMNNALILISKEMEIKKYLAKPDEGTLTRRLRHLKGKLWAKTGTLNGISSLCGFIETRGGKNLVFSIIISNFNKNQSVVKGFEDDLIDAIWGM